MKHHFKWCGFHNQSEYERFLSVLKHESHTEKKYETVAHLFYEDESGNYCRVELQVPTYLTYRDGETHFPWLVAYEVTSFEDYDTSCEIYTELSVNLRFDNAEELMLEFAKEYC